MPKYLTSAKTTNPMITIGKAKISELNNSLSISKCSFPPSMELKFTSKAPQHVEWKQAMSYESTTLMKKCNSNIIIYLYLYRQTQPYD